jgi:hypothetical protein
MVDDVVVVRGVAAFAGGAKKFAWDFSSFFSGDVVVMANVLHLKRHHRVRLAYVRRRSHK